MSEFLKHYTLYLTPISPIHIGCGEDFEPTNYVINKGVLYHFEPSKLHFSPAQLTELNRLANQMNLLHIQRFFVENKEQAVGFSHYFANVSPALEKAWHEKVGKVAQREGDGKEVFNKLAIERTAYLPYQNEVYIPASSFKGVLATALLNQAHEKNGNRKVNKTDAKKLVDDYIGTFKNSELRHSKFADFVPNNSVHSKIYYAVNFKKKPTKAGSKGKGLALRRECILNGQYRAFKSELALWQDKKVKKIQDYLQALDTFHRPIFNQELDLLVERRLVDSNWANSLRKLLQQPNQILIRLGKNGADSKILQGKDIAQIKIMKGKGVKPEYKDRSTTIWLAAENDHNENNLLPFGWAILELDDGKENALLKTWCENQPKPQFNKADILSKQREQKAQQQRLEAERQAKIEAEKQAEEAKQALLNSLSDNQRVIMDFVEKLQNTRERQADNTGSPLLKEAQALIESAAENWDVSDRQFVKEQITVDLLKSKIDFKKKDTEKTVKKWLNKLGIE